MTLGLTVLGGSAAWPNPGQGCSSYLVASDNTRLLLDCGPDTLQMLRQHADYRSIDAVIISHCHADHMLDLVAYRYGLKYGPGHDDRRVPLWLPPGGIERLDMLSAALAYGSEDSSGFWTDAFELHEFDPLATLQVGNLGVSFAPTQHFVPCFAMRVSDRSGRAIGYTADAGTIDPLVGLMEDATLLVAEATERAHDDRPVEQRGHLTPEDAGRLAAACRTPALLLTHLWSERPDDEVIRAAATEFNGRISVAKPGMYVDG
jgi:ribonuclease BN (tRNA processing enzyme)